MKNPNRQCLFMEPWIGRCTNERIEGSSCCAEHSRLKCQVCQAQAFTRCQASIGLMCGTPLCDECGRGEMCLYHASTGPVAAIAALLGRGPIPSVFASEESLTKHADEMEAVVEHLKEFTFGKLTMTAFRETMARRDAPENQPCD